MALLCANIRLRRGVRPPTDGGLALLMRPPSGCRKAGAETRGCQEGSPAWAIGLLREVQGVVLHVLTQFPRLEVHNDDVPAALDVHVVCGEHDAGKTLRDACVRVAAVLHADVFVAMLKVIVVLLLVAVPSVELRRRAEAAIVAWFRVLLDARPHGRVVETAVMDTRSDALHVRLAAGGCSLTEPLQRSSVGRLAPRDRLSDSSRCHRG